MINHFSLHLQKTSPFYFQMKLTAALELQYRFHKNDYEVSNAYSKKLANAYSNNIVKE